MWAIQGMAGLRSQVFGDKRSQQKARLLQESRVRRENSSSNLEEMQLNGRAGKRSQWRKQKARSER